MARNHLLSVLLLTSSALALGLDLAIPILHGCGNIEFDINFMKPTIIIYDAQ
jgi:hypothetical protein